MRGVVSLSQHSETSALRYRVIDIAGREVASGLAGSSASIDLSELLPGVFVVSVELPTGRQVLKFMSRELALSASISRCQYRFVSP